MACLVEIQRRQDLVDESAVGGLTATTVDVSGAGSSGSSSETSYERVDFQARFHSASDFVDHRYQT